MSLGRSAVMSVALCGLLWTQAVSAEKPKPRSRPKPPAAAAPAPAPPGFTAQETAAFSELCTRAGGATSAQGATISCVKGGAGAVATAGPPAPVTTGSAPVGAIPAAGKGARQSPSNWDLCTSYAEAVASKRSTASLESEIHRRGLGCAGSTLPESSSPAPPRTVSAAPTSSAPVRNEPAQPAPARRPPPPVRADACAGLSITNISKVQRGTIFTVTNTNAQPKSFRIHYQGIQSSRFVIAARTTKGFGVEVSGFIGGLGAVGAQSRGETDQLINDCAGLM